MSLYRTIIPKYTFIPYDFPTSRDGKYHCLLDDGQILRSRREQLGLSVYQVAEMAGIQFSQYQRLESGERFFSGCSMKIGLLCVPFFCLTLLSSSTSMLNSQNRIS